MAPRVDADTVRKLALARPDTEERPSYGTPGFRVRGQLFARLLPDDAGLVLRCGFERRKVLLDEESDVFHVTPHYAAWPWVVVRLEKIGVKRLTKAIEEAWRTAWDEAGAKDAKRRGAERRR